MKKIQTTMKLSEIVALEMELNGLKREGFEIPSFLNHTMHIKTKYWLTKLAKVLKSESESFNILREELIRKFGETTEDGKIRLETLIDKKINPKFVEFNKEETELLKQEVSLELYKFPIEIFDFETTYTYTLVNEFLIDEDDS